MLNLLHDNNEPDEYSEGLDLIFKLIQIKIENIAKLNSLLILNERSNIELLLDLLDSKETLIGIMSSEILTRLHSILSKELEEGIQNCPTGLTKLLNCMPNRSNEEISNQVIILIRELTATNEEMKKTVVFNEVSDLFLFFLNFWLYISNEVRN